MLMYMYERNTGTPDHCSARREFRGRLHQRGHQSTPERHHEEQEGQRHEQNAGGPPAQRSKTSDGNHGDRGELLDYQHAAAARNQPRQRAQHQAEHTEPAWLQCDLRQGLAFAPAKPDTDRQDQEAVRESRVGVPLSSTDMNVSE